MSNATVVFDPYAAAEMHNFVQTIVVNHNVASTGQSEWYPVAFFLKGENSELLGLLGDVRTAWLTRANACGGHAGARRRLLQGVDDESCRDRCG